MTTAANLTLLPWVRRGAASANPDEDTRGRAGMRGAADLTAALAVNDEPPAVSLTVRLRGPADVAGIDPNEIVRLDPVPGTTDFEPSYFPCIEFDRPDFPWLFTPARADGQGRLRPWLCLVVVRQRDGVTLQQPAGSGEQAAAARLPVLEIAASLAEDELPDLAESWAWAHAQAATGVANVDEDTRARAIKEALEGRPELSLSRLLCPRLLAPDTDYLACVVPTFDLGRRAGLNEPITDEEVTAPDSLTPAWSSEPPPPPPPPPPVRLPVYFSWQFRTGPALDFESLVRLLHAEPAPDRLGRRAVDISRPGFTLAEGVPASVLAGARLDIEGALEPMNGPDEPEPWSPEVAGPFQAALADIVNAPGVAAVTDPAEDPLLAPPLYGRWHAARATVAADNPAWFDVLNLDPRNRIVAAFGTRVVQEHQEALMAAAWEQAGDLQRATERARRLQLSVAVNASLHARHLRRLELNPEALLRVGAPVLARIISTGPQGAAPSTLLAAVADSMLPVHAVSAPMRRIGRYRGPITRRVASQGGQRIATATWIGRLNTAPPVPEAPASSLATFDAILRLLPPPITPVPTTSPAIENYGKVTAQTLADAPGQPLFQIAAEGQPVVVPAESGPPPGNDNATAKKFRAAAREHLARVHPGRLGHLTAPPPLRIGEVGSALLEQTRPQRTVAALARATISVGPNATAPVAMTPSTEAAGIETIMAAPQFRQPMYEALRDLGQEILLPGLDAVTANTVLGLQTNRRFVEAYMVGLNVEMGRELLWRGFPTDQRGTCFTQFWDARTTPEPRPDIGPIHEWHDDRRLGDPQGAPAREQFVLLLRSDLLRRYPTAVIYATPATVTNGVRAPMLDPDHPEREIYPAFRGSMDPDVSFFGFDLSSNDMLHGGNGAGHYIVIQQQPTEPRFRLDVARTKPVASWNDLAWTDMRTLPGAHVKLSDLTLPATQWPAGTTWGRNAAHMAGITRQLPVLIAIHASRFADALG